MDKLFFVCFIQQYLHRYVNTEYMYVSSFISLFSYYNGKNQFLLEFFNLLRRKSQTVCMIAKEFPHMNQNSLYQFVLKSLMFILKLNKCLFIYFLSFENQTLSSLNIYFSKLQQCNKKRRRIAFHHSSPSPPLPPLPKKKKIHFLTNK